MVKLNSTQPAKPDWAAGVRSDTRGPMLLSAASSSLFVFGFLGWATFAPISGAVVAEGVVAAAGQNLRIQHLEGGIVSEIAVQEGERVDAGQVLFTLDDTSAAANRNRIRAKLLSAMIRAERLSAERGSVETLAFSPDLKDAAENAGMKSYLDEQRQEFEIRLARYRQERLILGQRLHSLGRQREGLQAQKDAVEEQLHVVRDERERKHGLLEKGLTNRSEYTALLRAEAELVGQAGRFGADILNVDIQEVEAREQVARLETQRVETASADLNLLRVEISESQEQLSAAEDILTRTVVRSPAKGIVVRNNHNTIGSVVRPGEMMTEILPTTDRPLVQAHIPVKDIDHVKVGQEVRMHFIALNARVTPEVTGQLAYISADRLTDEKTQVPYFLARIEPTHDLPEGISADKVYPGMPVQAFIQTEQRTFATYVTRPLLDSFNRAFKEP
ncbi:HlyD family type I secretion periplasmic adaptor subunit [Pseudochelatococcus contaminans]|uniref:Membrane fusion protein (MFP) family protein n=1 Tax=Pseudochelatococcus contaminans TaxID=1538103 RepID=A0A7W5Z5F3_9HYPH|nr:HlyD family type I secretion periplasmic adaptor subunit [Pseudochelatococcus contaminans]MBB3810017.1 HlyD family secretion protein [Pseudochelatococcus contaminans]